MLKLRAVEMSEGVKGRIAVVTGGAKGIGAGISRALAAAGAHVVVADRDEPAAERFAASVRNAGAGATAAPCDVGDTGSVTQLIKKIGNELGAVDLLVNRGLCLVSRNHARTLGSHAQRPPNRRVQFLPCGNAGND
jgi:NADP-dependent 3-hydroxy acid dehydrogenase YdfG